MNTRLLDSHINKGRHFGPQVFAFCKVLRDHHVPYRRSNVRIICGAVYLEIGKGAIRYFTKENALRFLLQGGKRRLNVAKRLLKYYFRPVQVFGLQLYQAIS
jgi:hypothetical protein